MKNHQQIDFLAKMAKKVEKNDQNAKKSNFFVRTSFPPDFLLVKIGRLVLRSGDDEVLGDDDHFIIPRRLSSPAGDDRAMTIHLQKTCTLKKIRIFENHQKNDLNPCISYVFFMLMTVPASKPSQNHPKTWFLQFFTKNPIFIKTKNGHETFIILR